MVYTQVNRLCMGNRQSKNDTLPPKEGGKNGWWVGGGKGKLKVFKNVYTIDLNTYKNIKQDKGKLVNTTIHYTIMYLKKNKV